MLGPTGPIFAFKHFWNHCISSNHSKVAKFDPPHPPSGGGGVEKILGGEKIWGDKFWGHTSFGIFQIRWKTQICEANLCFPIFTNSSSLQLCCNDDQVYVVCAERETFSLSSPTFSVELTDSQHHTNIASLSPFNNKVCQLS